MTKDVLQTKIDNHITSYWNLQEEMVTARQYLGVAWEDLPQTIRLICTMCGFKNVEEWVQSIRKNFEDWEKNYNKLIKKMQKLKQNELNRDPDQL